MINTQFRAGDLTRLSFDRKPHTFVVVLGDPRRRNGALVVPVLLFTDPEAAQEAAAYAADDYASNYPLAKGTAFMSPHTLVPLCTYSETIRDEYATACSEPGIPTSFTIRCDHDATHVFRVRSEPDEHGPATEYRDTLCDEHAAQLLEDIATGALLGVAAVEEVSSS